MGKLLLLDLDGTLRKSKSESKFINDPYDQQPIVGALEQCDRYVLEGWSLIGITNQGGVAAGHKTLNNAILEQEITLKLFPISLIYFCPDYLGLICFKVDREDSYLIKQETIEEFGSFRKPGAGMLKKAIAFYDPTEVLMVGDRNEDEAAARAADIDFMWADHWRSS